MTPWAWRATTWRLRGSRAAQGCSSIGRAAVSKTAGCRFKSCHPCHPAGPVVDPPGTTAGRPPGRTTSGPLGHRGQGERGAVSDDNDAELTDEQLDREAPGVDDADELEAAEEEVAAEAAEDEDKVVATPARRRRGRITAADDEDQDDEDDDDAPVRGRRAARTASRPAGRETAATSGTGTR